MKELEITLRVRNNRLKERRETLGYDQAELAEAAGISLFQYGSLENMRAKPKNGRGEWTKSATRLAQFFCTDPDQLFPQAVQDVQVPVSARKMDAADVGRLLPGASEHQQRRLELNPDADLDRAALRDRMRDAMGQLTRRQRSVLEQFFGFNGDEQTYRAIGDKLDVSGARARQIAEKAMRRLRQPKLAAPLKPFIEGE